MPPACSGAASRSFEGAVLCLVLSLWLIFYHLRALPPLTALRPSVAAPALLVMLMGTALLLAHNNAVTGHPLRLPCQAAFEQYSPIGRFVFEKINRQPVYRRAVMERAFRPEISPWLNIFTRLYSNYMGLQEYYLGVPHFTLFLLALPSLRSARFRPVVLAAGAGGAAMAVIPIVLPHYLAPFAATMLVAAAHFVRTLPRVFALPPGHAWLAPAAVAVLALFQYAGRIGSAARGPGHTTRWVQDRVRIERELQQLPGRDLVIVSYQPSHSHHREWVYNRASIDLSGVVWARAMDPQNDALLRQYFAARRIWLLEADALAPRLEPLAGP